MNELRSFMMERARESDDRSGYLDLQFDQATDRLTLKDYQTLKKHALKRSGMISNRECLGDLKKHGKLKD